MTILNKLKHFRPVGILFAILTLLFLGSTHWLNKWGVDREVLMAGNIILLLVSLVSFLIAMQGLNNKNPHAFVRAIYGSIMIKFFICIVAALIYIVSFKKEINKPALFICMGLYLVYTFVEVSVLTKSLKKKSDAKEGSPN